MVHLERIKELCEKKNVTMKQAAIELGMTEQSLHKIIKANSTKIDTLLTMAQYFNVEPAYFFDNYSVDTSGGICISKEELEGLLKKVIAYSIHGFGMVKLEWDAKEQKFNSYFDILKKQYSPDASLNAFLDKHNIPITDSIKKDMDELKSRIKYYEGKSIIGNNKK